MKTIYIIRSLLFTLGAILLFSFSVKAHAQFNGDYGAISGTVSWGAEVPQSVEVGFTNTSTGFSTTVQGTNYNSGFILAPGTYTVSAFTNTGAGPNVYIGSQTATVVGGQTTANVNFDAESVSGLVEGSITVNGQPASGEIQFCVPNGPCSFNASDGTLYDVNGNFNIPLAAGDYIAHARLDTDPYIDLGSVPITVVNGQIDNDSSIQFGLSYGAISGTVSWGAEVPQSVEVGFTNTSTGFSTTVQGTNYNSGFILAPGTYTVSAFTNTGAGPNVYIGSQTATVVGGQTTANVNFDAESVSGLVEGSITVNGQPASGEIQFCVPNGPCSFNASDGTLYDVNGNFNIPLAAGDYIAHARLDTDPYIDLGSVPITVVNGQIDNDSSIQFGLSYGAISGTVSWGAEVPQSVEVGFTNTSTGFSTTVQGTNYNSGFILAPGTYTVSAFTNTGAGPNVYIGSQTATVVGGQTTANVNFDAESVSGLVEGSITVNGQPASGEIQFCVPNGPCSFNASDGTLYDVNGNFNIPLAAGDYIAHARLDTDPYIDLGSVPITVVNGQIDNIGQLAAPTPTPTATPTPTPTATLTPTPTVSLTPTPVTLTPSQNSFIKHDGQNQNNGASPFLELSYEGKERALIQFSESQIQAAVNNDPNFTATLKLTVVSANDNFGSSGRQIDVDKMEQAWIGGNGTYSYNGYRGTGEGVTWDCAIDSNITNESDNCSGSTAWDMLDTGSYPFDATPTATGTITNDETGTVSFNVTSDVQSFLNNTNTNYGWIIKKDNESQEGDVQFGSINSSYSPKLIITPQ